MKMELKEVYLVKGVNKNGEVVCVDEFKKEPTKAEIAIFSMGVTTDYYEVKKAYRKFEIEELLED
jgi:galactitol-specific phosphotransferase system IIB component